MATTKLENLINPQVMEDMIAAQLPAAIKFAPLAIIGTKLEKTAGNTLSIPKYAFIGNAQDVAEGEAIPVSKLTTSMTTVTVKKAGKGVEITDESVLSGHGDVIEEAANQIKLSIAGKIEDDLIASLETIEAPYVYEAGTNITPEKIAMAKIKFGELVDEPAVLFVTPSQYAEIITNKDFIALKDFGGKPVLMSGIVGEVYGCQVIVTSKLPINGGKVSNYIVKPGALGIEMKRSPQIETTRFSKNRITELTGDQHYATYLKNVSKAVKVIFDVTP